MAGYGRRFASGLTQRAVGNSFQFSVGILLREDPRYFPSERKGTWARIADAIAHTVTVRTDDGSRTLAVGRLAGTFGGGLLSRTWQPEGHDSIPQGLQSGAIMFGADIGWNVFREFWPDLKKRLRF